MSNITITRLQPLCRMQMGHNEGRDLSVEPQPRAARGLTHHNSDSLIIQWPLFHCNCFQNKQHLKSIPDAPRIVAFADGRGTEQLHKVMSFGSSEKSHLKFISIIMSLANGFVRKTYLHSSHLCFHVVSELAINAGLCVTKAITPRAGICCLWPRLRLCHPMVQELSTALPSPVPTCTLGTLDTAPRGAQGGIWGCLCRDRGGTG